MFSYSILVRVALIGLLFFGVSQTGTASAAIDVSSSTDTSWLDGFLTNLSQPLTILLLQIVLIVLLAKLCGRLVQMIGQPRVVGEIAAGILLGPSLFGYWFPEVSAVIFPTESLKNIQTMSFLGLILFMFVIGMDLNLAAVKKGLKTAVLVSQVSIIVPYLLGAVLAIALYEQFAPPGVSVISFALFMGIAMSITAFPVLARILQEKKLTHTPLGTLAITCAAVDDISAWCILAVVIGIVRASSLGSTVLVFFFALIYVVVMFQVVRPVLQSWFDKIRSSADADYHVMTIVFITLLISALIAELIGIHALFGAFVAGVIMPNSEQFRQLLTNRLEHLATIVLLPLFFAFTGLRTEFTLLNEWNMWLICLLVIAVAVVGKLAGTAIAARWSGMSWTEAGALGALMNTRGLMELVVLNIGYDIGVLSKEIFAIMVIMALVTTIMTGPLLSLFLKSKASNESSTANPLVLDNK